MLNRQKLEAFWPLRLKQPLKMQLLNTLNAKKLKF